MEQAHKFAVEKMCRVLKVSTSGYYKWYKCKDLEDEQKVSLEKLIKYEFERSRCTYGSPRITDELNAEQYVSSKSTVARYMRRMNIAARRKKKFKVTTDSSHDHRVFDNLLDRQFDVDKPATVWVSDITYIRVASNWQYLTTVIDLADRMVVGWSLSRDMSARNTVVEAFNNACEFRKPMKGFMFHSDRGVQYACHEFTTIVKAHQGIQSMSRKGNCWDNAVAESFFKTLKTESIYNYKITSQKQAFSIIFDYIDGWYNTQRRHSALNGLAPIDAYLLKSKYLSIAA
jgi:transposase InsO family protein